MCLLEKYQDIKLKVIDQQNCIQLLKPGIHHIYNQEYYYYGQNTNPLISNIFIVKKE